MPSHRSLVSVIAPVYNEGAVLEPFLHRLQAAVAPLDGRYRFEFIWVDDGSRDNSLALARELSRGEPRLHVLELRRNYGQTAALQAGIDAARGEVLITMDADLQHFPEEIPAFLAAIEGGADVVCGWRHQRQEGVVRRWPSRVANWIIRKSVGIHIHDVGTTFRAYRHEILNDIRLMGDQHRFIPVLAREVGARIREIPIQNIPRPEGHSNYGLGRVFNVLVDIVFLIFLARYLDRPIRLFGKLALLLFSLSGIIAAVLGWVWITGGVAVVREHSGWFTLGVTFMLAALQLLLTGVLAELMVRIYFRAEHQPGYHLRQVWRNGTATPGDSGTAPSSPADFSPGPTGSI